MISIQLGRPLLFHDKDIDTPLPTNVNDDMTVEEVLDKFDEEGQGVGGKASSITTASATKDD